MIIVNNKEVLNIKCEDASFEEANEIIVKLEHDLKQVNGIGLAAPQIGILKKVAIIRIPTSTETISINLVNAHIKQSYDIITFEGEGCLSFPNINITTQRYGEVQVSNAVKPHNFVATGLLAIAIQHELDHLNGILMFDREIKINSVKHKIRPNDPCSCGSKRKYKKCCGNK